MVLRVGRGKIWNRRQQRKQRGTEGSEEWGIWGELLQDLLICLADGNFASLAIFCKNLSWFSELGEGRFGTEGSKGSKGGQKGAKNEGFGVSFFRIC